MNSVRGACRGWKAQKPIFLLFRLVESMLEAAAGRLQSVMQASRSFQGQGSLRSESGRSPYSAEGTNPTTNASDPVYSGETDGANLLSGDNTNGYTARAKSICPFTAQ
jgi:hypothetical protein